MQEALSYEGAKFLVKMTRFVNLTRDSLESTLKKLTVRVFSHGSAWRLYGSLGIAETPLEMFLGLTLFGMLRKADPTYSILNSRSSNKPPSNTLPRCVFSIPSPSRLIFT